MYSHHADSYLNLQGSVMDFCSVKLQLIIVFIIVSLKIPSRIHDDDLALDLNPKPLHVEQYQSHFAHNCALH